MARLRLLAGIWLRLSPRRVPRLRIWRPSRPSLRRVPRWRVSCRSRLPRRSRVSQSGSVPRLSSVRRLRHRGGTYGWLRPAVENQWRPKHIGLVKSSCRPPSGSTDYHAPRDTTGPCRRKRAPAALTERGTERPEAATRDHGAGYYHAIHFDLHGGLLSADFEKRQAAPARWPSFVDQPFCSR